MSSLRRQIRFSYASSSMRKWFVVSLVLSLLYCLGPAGSAQSPHTPTENGRKLVHKVEPHYPEVARRLSLGGTVKVVAGVAPDGNVKKVEPVGGSPLLVQAAQSAISQGKYAPGPESRETVELHFTP